MPLMSTVAGGMPESSVKQALELAADKEGKLRLADYEKVMAEALKPK